MYRVEPKVCAMARRQTRLSFRYCLCNGVRANHAAIPRTTTMMLMRSNCFLLWILLRMLLSSRLRFGFASRPVRD